MNKDSGVLSLWIDTMIMGDNSYQRTLTPLLPVSGSIIIMVGRINAEGMVVCS